MQIETFQNSNAPYLGNPLENFNYLNVLPENSRRLRALPVWFSLLAYGKEGFRDIVENSAALALHFGNELIEDGNFELLAPIRLNNVCFTLKGDHNQEKVSQFLTLLNDRGKVFMTPTVYQNRKGIRASFVNWRTTEKDIKIIIEEIKSLFQKCKFLYSFLKSCLFISRTFFCFICKFFYKILAGYLTLFTLNFK